MKFFTYLKQVRAELSHVVWPDRRTAIAHTLLVLLVGAIVALIVSLLDAGFTRIVEQLIIR